MEVFGWSQEGLRQWVPCGCCSCDPVLGGLGHIDVCKFGSVQVWQLMGGLLLVHDPITQTACLGIQHWNLSSGHDWCFRLCA